MAVCQGGWDCGLCAPNDEWGKPAGTKTPRRSQTVITLDN